MSDDVVRLPTAPIQIPSGFSVFLIGGHFLLPPGDVVDAESRSRLSPQHQELALKIWIVQLQNTIFNVVAPGSAHGEEAVSLQFKDLPAHQVQNMGANAVDLSAVPFLHGAGCNGVIVFMIAIHKCQCEGQAFQPVQDIVIPAIAEPHTAEITADDHNVFFRHLYLLGKVFLLEPLKVPVAIPCNPYHMNFLLFGCSTACSISIPFRRVTRIISLERTVTFSNI